MDRGVILKEYMKEFQERQQMNTSKVTGDCDEHLEENRVYLTEKFGRQGPSQNCQAKLSCVEA